MSNVFNNIQIPFQSTPTTQAAAAASNFEAVEYQKPITVKEAIASTRQADTFETTPDNVANKPKKRREGPIKTLKRGIANIKKFFATVGAYTAGVAKGIIYGGISGIGVLGTCEFINLIKKGVAHHKKAEAHLINSKPLAIVVAGIALVGCIWNASLKATDERSDIHDKYIGTDKR